MKERSRWISKTIEVVIDATMDGICSDECPYLSDEREDDDSFQECSKHIYTCSLFNRKLYNAAGICAIRCVACQNIFKGYKGR